MLNNITKVPINSTIYLKGLYPCDPRKINYWRYKNYFEHNGYTITEDLACADVVVLWTCGFRADYRENSIMFIRKLIAATESPVFICGCLPTLSPINIISYS